jgi:hypothetical protein
VKTIRNLIIVHLMLAGSLLFVIYKAKSELEVSASVEIHAPGDFYGPLATHGTWVEVSTYGRCFRPEGIDAGWQPYCEGIWVWTDCGWYWQSDEPWAWACYHYGTWFDDPAQGWIWVPGIEWAPAWVTWRTGGDFIGWVPCAPRGAVVAPALFAFVDVNHFQDPIRRATVTVNNTAAIGQTRLLAGPGREKRNVDGKSQEIVVNHGPDVEAIQKATGRQLQPVPIQSASQRSPAPHNLAPADRNDKPADVKQPVDPLNENRPSIDGKDQAVPNQNAGPQPERPTETRQPITDGPASPQKQDSDVPERPVPEKVPAVQPEKPAETAQPPVEHFQRPPTQKTPASPAKQEKPVDPPKEEKPANPPQGQEKKDGLGRSPSMMADSSSHSSPCSGAS